MAGPKFKVYKIKRIRNMRFIKALSMLFLWLFVLGAIWFLLLFIYIQYTLPDPESIATRRVGESTKIYDRTGEVLLYDIHGEEKRTIIAWEKIPEYIKKATIASEDADFYTHKGLDLRGIIRAFLKDLRNFEISQGGSTITQQLVKKALFGDEKTITRKVKEILVAIEIERRFTKDEIFWMYLNQIPYGSNSYGIEAASKQFFGKSASDLTLNESAIIASLPKAPTYYSPYGNHVEELMSRKNDTLSKMFGLGFITEKELNHALSEKVEFKSAKEEISAPHFVIMIKEYLISKYGEEAVESGGFKITTTLDSAFQEAAEEVVEKYSVINKERYKAKNAALAAVNPKTGDLLALVGSANYFDIENQGNFNVATAKRQPGSAFKPFAYAAAFQAGYPDSTILFDVKTEFNPNCQPDSSEKKDPFGLDCYHPQNYDGDFRGPVTLRQSLSRSLNVPSVKVLYLAGVDNTIDLARKMGITTLEDRSRYGLSLVLGGAEVKLVDLVSAYGVFANEGVRNPWYIVKKIELPNGDILEESKPSPLRVVDPKITRLVSDILSDNSARSPVFGFSSSLYFPDFDVAAKTGTTQENRDAWVAGYSPNFAAGVWVGNNDNQSMTREGAGISAAGPMWHEFMVKALSALPRETFNPPDPVFTNKIMLNGQYLYKNEQASGQEMHNILFYVNKNDPLGPFPENPSADPQFNNWEWAIRSVYR
ncbi:MAG: hypothetical protein A2925_00170 [Candidatus Yanofskybacteria bacterium RIFCSPLOWO2_01_FULL_44_22]|uniref:Uncharacterized protein n=2 Tax=Candidatus Yanofskyibacteriota TaxID=1752733 RepID=A0A1F8GJC9_9BACT|nr:MAG: Penicillin-binding protein, 1A family [Candidatus Yanofskybacteria bacterium GW2011_GWA2_44_9]OGN05443.1 MAG: hypothetical protein A2659_03865 [Candidatus Yanofskybacteria bacterium RIFCSPHIGHO2_01_FULL_44_24]OGN25433.1 MAG: hypothetical protein A2925_00170 [Candidatus Yanofskybacteria bacterium RIFCSPLOWO2_01_FULL_44_22]